MHTYYFLPSAGVFEKDSSTSVGSASNHYKPKQARRSIKHSPSSTSLNSEILNFTFSSGFQCKCSKNCSFDGYCRGQCLSDVFPFLDTQGLSDADRQTLTHRLTAEADELTKAFGELVLDTFDSFASEGTQPEEIMAVAIAFCPVENRPSFTTVSGVQMFLQERNLISAVNYRLLEKIIYRLGTAEDKKRLDEYKVHFVSFCKRGIFEVPSRIVSNGLEATDKENCLVVKVKESRLPSFGDLYSLENAIAEVIPGLDQSYIFVRDIQRGCVEVSFEILSKDNIFPLAYSCVKNLDTIGIRVKSQPKEKRPFQSKTESQLSMTSKL